MIGAPLSLAILEKYPPVGQLEGALQIAGTSTPAFVGDAVSGADATIAGTSTVSFAGDSLADVDGALNAPGASTADFAWTALHDGAFSIAGVGDFAASTNVFQDGALAAAGTATGPFYSAFRLFTEDDPSSTTVADLQTATDATLIRDPFTWP